MGYRHAATDDRMAGVLRPVPWLPEMVTSQGGALRLDEAGKYEVVDMFGSGS